MIDFQEVRTGQRDDGTVYAIYSWARKLGQAGAGLLTGVVLTAIGFDSAKATAGESQTPEVVDGIFMIANVLPGIACILVGLALLFLYPLKKKVVLENVEILRERRASRAAAKVGASDVERAYDEVDADPGAGGHVSGRALPPEVVDGDEDIKY